MSKKKVIIITTFAVILIACAICAFMMANSASLQQNENSNSENVTNTTQQPADLNSNTLPANEHSTAVNDNISSPNENVPNSETAYDPTVENNVINDDDAYNSRPVYRAYEDDLLLERIDQDKAKQIASDFLRSFCTYNADSLRNGSYKNSWSKYVTVTSDMSILLKQRMNNTWNYNTSTYPDVYSLLTNVTVDSVYVSHVSHDNVIAVALTAIVDENQGQPGDMEWNTVNTYIIHYAVYLNQDLKVVDVLRQDAKTLNFDIFHTGSGGVYQ